jgi:hypothetical protein
MKRRAFFIVSGSVLAAAAFPSCTRSPALRGKILYEGSGT